MRTVGEAVPSPPSKDERVDDAHSGIGCGRTTYARDAVAAGRSA
ncbi:hypothetical protein K530_52820 [Streptomyces noursei CCRC 11814]|nr:hypothetical protein K530_52820 [Streptomyces noursei CCRC 11814]